MHRFSPTPTSRSKGQKSRAGAYCGGHLAAQLVKVNFIQQIWCQKRTSTKVDGRLVTVYNTVTRPVDDKPENPLDIRGVENDASAMPPIYLRPHVTLTFDLLTPKVDRFMPLPRELLVPICVKIGLFVFKISCLQAFERSNKQTEMSFWNNA